MYMASLANKSAMSPFANAMSWVCAMVIVAFILLGSVQETSLNTYDSNRPCDEIYVVREGETLHTISDKCDDPFIIEQNPHINDPDDVFPGLVIKITTQHGILA